jgi:MoaA/NifB/PqqE/SkfB family radical SAM enzyme
MWIERVYYEICNACNFQCKHCFEAGGASGDLINTESLLNFHQKISGKIHDFVITGGEPTFHPDVYKIIDAVAKENQFVVLTTNGSLLDINRMGKLMEQHHSLHIQFSLDAFSKDVFEGIRGRGSYDKVMETIMKMNRFHERVHLSMTLLKSNVDEVDAVIAFAKEHGFSLFFPSLIPVGAVIQNWDELIPDSVSFGTAEDKIISAVADFDFVSSNKVGMVLANYMSRGNPTQTRTIKIDARGFVLPCAVVSEQNMLNCGETPLSITQIKGWNDFLSSIVQTHMCEARPEALDICASCEYKSICSHYYCGFCRYSASIDKEKQAFFCNSLKRMYGQINETNRNA